MKDAIEIQPDRCEKRQERFRQKRIAARLFSAALAVRLLVVISMWLAPAWMMHNLSRDSAKYDSQGRFIAGQFDRGEVEWANWIDDGWYQFVGLVYWSGGPHLEIVMMLNCVFAACATLLIYRIALTVFADEPVARTAAYIFALFPSIVYYTSMPLKEAASLLGLLMVVWGVVTLLKKRGDLGLLWIAAGLLILASLRVYMCVVCLGCALVCLMPFRLSRGWAGAFQVASLMLAGGLCAYFVATVMGIRQEEYTALKYFDVEYINSVRVGLTERGNARMFHDAERAAFGQSWINDLRLIANGIFYFLFSIDVTNVTRDRQLAAVPEMLFILYCLPYLFAGVTTSWNRAPRMALPVLLFGVVIAGVYTSAATNMGALYRWRAQAMPFVIMLIVYGAAVRGRGILSLMLRRLRRSLEVRQRAWSA